ncbi:hypothetical protein [Shewanella cutis]|uniref:Uncharacterized protein n=1 Tax=Shewanella cutis TaxID=2766780 RepID=A0ABS9R1A9_9GAMM|nr:hypothetical protein [Shewanella sp. PS-2]MCG9966382.1 hypothetical protein [Shewanella sp. PS-2]
MEVNFFKDLELEITRILSGFGYSVPSFEELRAQDERADDANKSYERYNITNLMHHFLTVVKRRVPIKKWNVHVSLKLKNRVEIQNIASKLSAGEDVNRFLSKQVKRKKQKTCPDGTLYEWGIYHIHFELGGNGDDMLFVYLDENNAYLIDILPHEKENITWTKSDLVQILHDNWPQAISKHIFHNPLKDSATPQSQRIISDEERKHLRKKNGGANTIVNDGVVYKKMGGGVTPSGIPFIALRDTDAIISDIQKLQDDARANKQAIYDFVDIQNPKLRLKLVLDDDLKIEIIEEITNTKMT